MAAGEGFEPSHTESESAVLPLHNPAISCELCLTSNYYTHPSPCCQAFFSDFLRKWNFFSLRKVPNSTEGERPQPAAGEMHSRAAGEGSRQLAREKPCHAAGERRCRRQKNIHTKSGVNIFSGGTTQNRTGDKGFADLCLTSWLWCHRTGEYPAI